MSMPAFETVEHTLGALRCDIGAAECHGILCGMMSAGGTFDSRLWLLHVSGQEDLAGWESEDAREVFDALATSTAAALMDDDYSFTLMLPDEGQALGLRAAAFACWCRGYLAGIALAGLVDLAALSEDARGFVADLEKFCKLSIDETEEDERALEELIEFTRMGVLVVRSDLPEHDIGPGESGAPVLH